MTCRLELTCWLLVLSAGCSLNFDHYKPKASKDSGADGGQADAGPHADQDAAADGCKPQAFYIDADGDGHGKTGSATHACVAPSGYVTSHDDCDDSCPSCHPGGTETCDGKDNDCNGKTDDLAARSCSLNKGVCKVGTQTCGAGKWSSCTGKEPSTEICNHLDDNCDGTVDELTQTDPKNCGSCGYACAGTLACKAGVCEQVVKQLSLSPQLECAILSQKHNGWDAGSLVCWGQNINNRLRAGTNQSLDIDEPTLVPDVGRVRYISQIQARTCVVLADSDTVRCWGRGSTPEALGSSSMSGIPDGTLADVMDVPGVVEVAVIDSASCARSSTGRVSCWGESDANGTSTSSYLPYTITGSGVTALANAGDLMCMLMSDGTVQSWGSTSWLSLTQYPYAGGGTPKLVAGSHDAVAIAGAGTGAASFCALLKDGSAACWGDNSSGQLGNGTGGSFTPWGPVKGAKGSGKAALDNLEQISCGLDNCCALDKAGQVYCWGQQADGELGLDPSDKDATSQSGGYPIYVLPRAVPGLPDITAVAVDGDLVCAVRRSGQTVCMGYATSGEIGDGFKISRTTPTATHFLP